MSDFYHIYSNGTRADILFPGDEDKVYAVNSLAIGSNACEVKVLVFIINDTHFHLIAYGPQEEVTNYAAYLKARISKFLICKKQNRSALGAGFQITSDPIKDRDECLRKFMYVYRNCLDFYNGAPWTYPWGIGNILFNPSLSLMEGSRMGDLSHTAQRAMFGVRDKLPDDWRYDDRKMILPSSFVDVSFVMQLFGSVRAFLAFLFVRKEDEQAMKQQVYSRQIEMRSLEDLRKLASEYAAKLYRKSLRACLVKEKLQIAQLMIKDKVAVKSVSLMKALYLRSEDLDLL